MLAAKFVLTLASNGREGEPLDTTIFITNLFRHDPTKNDMCMIHA